MDFQAGSKVGDYVLDAHIGGGSFGTVWRAHHEQGGEIVAIKLLTGSLASREAAALRADIEVLAAAAAARSQHVVKVLSGGTDPVPFIVMEYVEGSDLHSLLLAEGRLTPRRTIDVGIGISDALRALFDAGIIHRDIKPANVMITPDSQVTVLDFGGCVDPRRHAEDGAGLYSRRFPHRLHKRRFFVAERPGRGWNSSGVHAKCGGPALDRTGTGDVLRDEEGAKHGHGAFFRAVSRRALGADCRDGHERLASVPRGAVRWNVNKVPSGSTALPATAPFRSRAIATVR